ncbi:MAG: ABC-F family ATP-binding cassette domain-containing protein [Edaphocola sp.]
MLLALNNVSFSFGARPMLREANWQIGEGERIGLIGPNGAGKSTLLRLIMGEYTPEGGSIQRANDTTIGFFNQDLLSFSTKDSILSVGMTAFEKAVAIEKTMEELMAELETKGDDEELLLEYSEALHDFEVAGGYEMEHRSAEVLEGLGFSTQDLQKPYDQFSGGWRMRVLLAKMILQQPDILMLDEPTNHLDLPSIEWLERYLQSYPGTVVIVSHDRYFLDRMVTRIVELFQQQLISYSGNYTFYETEKATRMEFLEREYENQQKYIKQQERFVERFRAKASKAAQAQSALKRLDKLDRIELPDDSVPRMNISFAVDMQPGKIICDIKHAYKSYGDVSILKDAQLEINRGDKIALVGANGKGKSTLMRIVAGTEDFEGERSGWHNVKASFYAQHQLESLRLEDTLLEEMKHCGSGKTEMELRALLGCFLFAGDDVFKKIKVLSGGEKARVSLAKVIAGKANFLLLDEPTNHLDITSVELLIEALNKYQGTYVLISHDRYFVSQTANRFWEIEDGKVIDFKGTYEEWVLWKQDQLEKKKTAPPAPVTAAPKPEPQKQASVPTKESQDKKRELQKQQKEFEKVEDKLNKADARKTLLEQQMADPAYYADKDKFKVLEKEYADCVAQLDRIRKEYDGIFERMLELEQ